MMKQSNACWLWNPNEAEISRKRNAKQIAEQIGLGALVYSMLSVDNNKDIVFDINEALSFDGQNRAIHSECTCTGKFDLEESQTFKR